MMRTNASEGVAASSATERARRASVEADDAVAALPDAQVAAKPRRRRFTAEYKRRILKTADALREPGESAPSCVGRGCIPPFSTNGARSVTKASSTP